MKIPLVAGRTFTRADFESSAKPKPIVVNRTFAQTVFGSGDPLTKRGQYRTDLPGSAS